MIIETMNISTHEWEVAKTFAENSRQLSDLNIISINVGRTKCMIN